MNSRAALVLALAAASMSGPVSVNVTKMTGCPTREPSDPDIAARYRDDRRQRKAAEFAKRTPKGGLCRANS